MCGIIKITNGTTNSVDDTKNNYTRQMLPFHTNKESSTKACSLQPVMTTDVLLQLTITTVTFLHN